MLGLFSQKEEINVKDLVAKGAVVLDVRSKEEFAGGHVQGAINIPLDTLSSESKKIGDKNTYIITCCMSGGRSSVAKSILHKAGYDNVHNGGGWHSLQAKLQ